MIILHIKSPTFCKQKPHYIENKLLGFHSNPYFIWDYISIIGGMKININFKYFRYLIQIDMYKHMPIILSMIHFRCIDAFNIIALRKK